MSKAADQKTNLSKMERVREIHRLIRRFTDHPLNESFRVTAEILAQHLHVTDRQIRRDLDILRERIDERDVYAQLQGKGPALVFDRAKLSYHYTRPVDLSVWIGRLDDEELGSLLVAQQALAVFSGMPLAKQVSEIFEDDAGGMVGNARSGLRDEITELISFYPDGAGKIDPEQFTTIFRGLLFRQQLAVSYRSKASGRPVERLLHPYHLCCFKHQWRLVAHDSRHDGIRVFVVTPRRLQSVKLMNRSFKRPEGLNAHEYLARVGEGKARAVRLRIASDGAHHVLEREWRSLKSVQEHTDGSVEAVFEVGDFGEFKRFVLAFGSDCEVLEPADFREEIQLEARRVLEQGKAT